MLGAADTSGNWTHVSIVTSGKQALELKQNKKEKK
jgi:hypothetical protein